MDPKHLRMDERLRGICAYCGDRPDTRDHVPSKVLIDTPYPAPLPVVEACGRCNNSFSLDEQYLACFLECVICGTVDTSGLRRSNITRILENNPTLRTRFSNSRQDGNDGDITWIPEFERIQNVVMKLARGHMAYELYPNLESTYKLGFKPIGLMSEAERARFESLKTDNLEGWSELGSRAFYREVGKSPDGFERAGDWVVVQPNRYRYAVSEANGPLVRMVLSEYLACEVCWGD